MQTTDTRPAFRKSWTHGAKAMPEADTFAAMKEGFKRCRKSQMVHMPNSGEAGDQPCAVCGVTLREPYAVNKGEAPSKADQWSTWDYNPRTKRAVGMHYYCSWSALLGAVFSIEI